jgi:hypothetical protein
MSVPPVSGGNDQASILSGERFGRIGEHPIPHPTLASARWRCQIDITTASVRQCGRIKFDDALLIPAGAPVGQPGHGRGRE